jgi:hypothetical protein
MLVVALFCGILIASTTAVHYEILGWLNERLFAIAIPNRSKLLVVIFMAFVAHAVEIALYGFSLYVLVQYLGIGSLSGPGGFSLANCLYFSAETYTSLGFGDVVPAGQIRLLAGTEALNGLLLIGWSASFAYLAMERFWTSSRPGAARTALRGNLRRARDSGIHRPKHSVTTRPGSGAPVGNPADDAEVKLPVGRTRR